MNKIIFATCASAMLCMGVSAQEAQKDSLALQKLDEVVVSDSRFNIKRENSGKTVIKISAEELERNQGRSIAEIINTRSGFEISGSRGVQGSVLGVFARGGRGRQVLIVIDGVRVSDPSSFSTEYDLRLLSTANVESIEIIKGAASTLYGTNAATAVINITTKKAPGKTMALNVLSSVGTNQTAENQNFNASDFSNSARIGGTLDRFTYTAQFAHNYADGLSAIATLENEDDPYSSISSDLRFGYRFSDKLSFSVYGNQTKIATAFDESFGLMDAPFLFLSQQERAGASIDYAYNENGSLHFNGAYTHYDSESRSTFANFFKGENTVVDVFHKYNFNNRFHTIFGFNYLEDQTAFEQDERFTIMDPYFNMVYISPFGLNTNVGCRVNTHSAYGTSFVYNLNPSFTFKTKAGYFKVLTSYATSYITPSLTQLFGNFGANDTLEPEDNRTLEGGFEYAAGADFRLSGLYFNRKEENFVFYDNVTGTFNNAANTIRAEGLEMEFYWSATELLRLTANYTFTERKGDSAIRIPKHKMNFNASYKFSETLDATIGYAFTGRRSDTDFNDFPFIDVSLASFSLLDIHLQYQVIPNKLKVFLNATNLMNERYTEVLGFTTRGRNLRIGLNLNL
ncbi:MAG: TonB-dependent receptor plug domain-containing protein [Flavobacteriaceae bacterium]